MDIVEFAKMRKTLGGGSGGNGGAPADWNANEGEAGYVKNRTHYIGKTLLFDETIFFDGTEGFNLGTINIDLIPNETYTVVFDGVTYECVASGYNGNYSEIGDYTYETVPFYFAEVGDGYAYTYPLAPPW